MAERSQVFFFLMDKVKVALLLGIKVTEGGSEWSRSCTCERETLLQIISAGAGNGGQARLYRS